MKTNPLRTLLTIALLCTYTAAFTGCENQADTTATATSSDDHDHADHDGHDHEGHDHDDHEGHDHDDHEGHDHAAEGHDEHAGHDHPAHGPNGGHMVELSGGAHAEWAHDDDKDLLTVFVEKPETVTKVEMKTVIGDKETSYEFEKKESDESTTFQLTSPGLLTSIKMGDAVKTQLIIATADGEVSGKVLHHSH
ncbi:MAG: hypothetical protein AB8B91_23275 [Rubripirellula sp.]